MHKSKLTKPLTVKPLITYFMCPFLCVLFFSYFSRGPANTNLVVLCGCKGTALFMSPPMTDCGEIEWWSLHWASNERMSREQCEPTNWRCKTQNSAIPQNNPTRNFDFEQARMAIYFSDMRVRIRGPIDDTLWCTLNLVGRGNKE